MRLIRQGWLAYIERASGYQSVAVLNALYFVVFGPSVLVARLFGARLLDLDARARPSYWVKRQPAGKTVEALARHF